MVKIGISDAICWLLYILIFKDTFSIFLSFISDVA